MHKHCLRAVGGPYDGEELGVFGNAKKLYVDTIEPPEPRRDRIPLHVRHTRHRYSVYPDVLIYDGIVKFDEESCCWVLDNDDTQLI